MAPVVIDRLPILDDLDGGLSCGRVRMSSMGGDLDLLIVERLECEAANNSQQTNINTQVSVTM